MPQSFGPYTLIRPIADGGMAQVWLARHAAFSAPLAVKIMVAKESASARYAALFGNEVRVMAALEHPNIIAIHDYGVLDRDVKTEKGLLKKGLPYLAMEYAPGGTLAKRPMASWDEYVSVFEPLLLALNHAHARGVVHRDLKPANILFGGDRDEVLKLTDFGVARLDGASHSMVRMIGTLHYMAPEQIRGDSTLVGPWTDIYALACVSWRILTGNYVFSGEQIATVLYAHLHRQAGEFEARIPVPEGTEQFLRALLQKECAARPQSALEVLDMLRTLRGVRAAGAPRALDIVPENAPTVIGSENEERVSGDAVEQTVWGATASLWGLRSPPSVGRTAERQALLSQAHATKVVGRAKATAIFGPNGAGKSHLAEWLAITVMERGIGFSTRVPLSADEVGPANLRRILERLTRTEGATREQAERRLRHRFKEEDAEVRDRLLDMLHPTAEKGFVAGIRGAAEAERMLEFVIQRLRPKGLWVIVLDDLPSGDPLWSWIGRWSDEAELGPTLIVATSRDEVGSLPVPKVVLGPMPEEEIGQLADAIVRLPESDRHNLVTRANGSPGALLAKVGDWLETGEFEVSIGSRRLTRTTDGQPTLDDGWHDRLSLIHIELGEAAVRVLEVSAVLGAEVRDEDLDAILRDPGTVESVRRWALSRRWLMRTETGFRFVDRELRAFLVERGREHGRLEEHHAAVAAVLIQRDDPDVAERLVHHLLKSNQVSQAVDYAVVAARRRVHWFGPGDAVAYLERVSRSDAIEAKSLPWLRLMLIHAEISVEFQPMEEVIPRLKELGARARQLHLEEVGLQSLMILATVLSGRREYAAALAQLSRVANLAQRKGLKGLFGRASAGAARAKWRLSGVNDDVLKQFRVAVDALEEEGEAYQAALAGVHFGNALAEVGRYPDAEEVLASVTSTFERLGATGDLARVEMSRGDMAVFLGRLDEAYDCFQRAWRRFDALGWPQRCVAELNLAGVALRRGQPEDAISLLTGVESETERLGWRRGLAGARISRAAALAQLGRLDEAGELFIREFDIAMDAGEKEYVFLAETLVNASRGTDWHGQAQEFLAFQLGERTLQ